jgi:hypothetical protein
VQAKAGAKVADIPGLDFHSSAALANMDLPEVRVFVPKLITAGLTIIAGRAKAGKSWMMLALCHALTVLAGIFLGQAAVHAKPYYLALEDNKSRMKKRLKKLGMENIEFTYTTRAPRIDQGLVDALSQAIERDGYDVIIIDTLAAIRPAGVGKKGVWSGDYDITAALQKLAGKYNVAVLVVTHTKKSADKVDAQDAITSTTGILAGADGFWIFQRPQGHRDWMLTVQGRDIEAGEYALRFDKPTARWVMLGPAEQVVHSDAQQKILDVLGASTEPMQWAALKLQCGLGSIFDASLARLITKELVEKDDDGRYRRVDGLETPPGDLV